MKPALPEAPIFVRETKYLIFTRYSVDFVMVDAARAIGRSGGVIGARMTGGGFGGSTVTLCESSKAREIAATLSNKYHEATGITPQIFASRPSLGAHLV